MLVAHSTDRLCLGQAQQSKNMTMLVGLRGQCMPMNTLPFFPGVIQSLTSTIDLRPNGFVRIHDAAVLYLRRATAQLACL